MQEYFVIATFGINKRICRPLIITLRRVREATLIRKLRAAPILIGKIAFVALIPPTTGTIFEFTLVALGFTVKRREIDCGAHQSPPSILRVRAAAAVHN
jgi:hypothetical protein